MKSYLPLAAFIAIVALTGCTKTVYVVAPTPTAQATLSAQQAAYLSTAATIAAQPSPTIAPVPTDTPVPVVRQSAPPQSAPPPPPTLEACGTPAQCLRVVQDSLDPGKYTPWAPPPPPPPPNTPVPPPPPPTLTSRPKLWLEVVSYMALPHFQEWLNSDPRHPGGTVSCPNAGYDARTNYWGVTCQLIDNDGYLYVGKIINISDDCTTNPPTC